MLRSLQDIATAWAQAGAAGIVLVGRNLDSLNAAAANVQSISAGLPILVQKTDVSSEADVKILFEKVKAKFGKAIALVNSAGAMGGGMVGEAEPSAWWQDFVSLMSQDKKRFLRPLPLTLNSTGNQPQRDLPYGPLFY